MKALPSRRRFLKITAVHAAAVAGLGWSVGRAAETLTPQRWRGIALGGDVGIDLWGDVKESGVFETCRQEMLRLEAIFSLYRNDSELSRLNRHGRLAEASAELLEVLAVGLAMSSVTDGAFDVTIHPLCVSLAAGEMDLTRVEAARSLVDYRDLVLTGRQVHLRRPGMAVTLNGLAQGYITDRITAVLAQAGYTAALVDLGEKRALGAHPEGRPWRVGVRAPDGGNALAGVLDLGANRAVATSGGYGQRYKLAGRHHLLDARDGQSRTTWQSVSVLANTALTADALSTALSVSAPTEAARILHVFPADQPEARVLTAEGEWASIG